VTKERVRLRIGNMGKAVLMTGQVYQDPKDALNEFVSNAADEYAQAGVSGGRIRIVLQRRGRHPVIAVDDAGRGMDADRLREITRNLFQSAKAGDPRTIGEKAIGLLAFQQIGARCDIITRPCGSAQTLALRLERGKPIAELDLNERRRARPEAGTTAYIGDVDPDVLRVLTLRKLVDYLRRRRGAALARGDYEIEVTEGRRSQTVTPEEPDGIRLDIPARQTPWGRVEFALYVAPRPDRHRRVAVVGAGGTTIIDDVAEIEEFNKAPWSSDQISGRIAHEGLNQTTGRRAVLRDREAFPAFLDAVATIEPVVLETLERVARQVDLSVTERLNDTVRRIFGRVLRELSDLENPMRTAVGIEPGEGALLGGEHERRALGRISALARKSEPLSIDELMPTASAPQDVSVRTPSHANPVAGRSRSLPNLAPDPSPNGLRSRFDDGSGLVYYNDRHPDYLLVKAEEAALLDYLATLVAKEYVVFNNPRAAPGELAEEMVRMLVRVRRYLPRRL
jgi:Histidine kinase-, DNA gyrase B-, and HSP90-like ATPase